MTQSLDGIVRRGALAYPSRVAVIDGDLEWTWADFDREVSRAADALRRAGIGPGGRVACAAHNSARYFALYYAGARLGAILCPLNYLLAVPELAYVLADFEPELVLVAPEFADQVAAAAPAGTRVMDFGAAWEALLVAADPGAEFPPPDPQSLHMVMYTSGTTGRPKGAAHTQAAHYLDGLVTALGYRISQTDRYLVHAPSFHAASWDHAKVFLISDGTIVILPRFDPQAALREITRHRVTVLFGVPAVLRQLLDHPDFGRSDLSSIRLVYFGGALGSPDVLRDFARALGRSVDYVHVYGLTEGGPHTSLLQPHLAFEKMGSIGTPLPGLSMDVVDPVTDRPLPIGEVGEIVVRGDSTMHGYWRRPEETAHALRGGWLHTGDLGRRDQDGCFTIVDRIKDMIRSGGENVYAAEVERALLEHPDVLDVAVVGLPDPRWDERVTAVVIARPGVAPDQEDLRAFCRERLAGYKVPKQFVFTDAFPRTPLGKIAKHRLRAELGGAGATEGGTPV